MLDTLLHQDLLKMRKEYYGFTLVIKCTITHNCSIQESQKNDSNAKKNHPIFAAIKNQTPVKSNFAFDMLWSSLAVEVLACTLITKFLIFCSSNMLLVHWATYMICHIVSNPVSNTKIGETHYKMYNKLPYRTQNWNFSFQLSWNLLQYIPSFLQIPHFFVAILVKFDVW